MPRLKTVTPEEAQGKVKEVYDDLTQKKGKVFNIFQGMGNSAAALKAYLAMNGALAEGDLSPQDREVVYLAVSQKNRCNYCLAAHTMISKGAGLSEDQVVAIRQGNPQDEKHAALHRFVRRVTETQGFVDDEDIQAVRDAGYSDGQIAESIAFIGLATYSNLFNHVYATELDFPSAPEI